jgi:hypothetical protein
MSRTFTAKNEYKCYAAIKFMWNMGGTLDNFSSELAEIQHV